MKLIGKHSITSALRWFLGFINVFVMIAACAMALIAVASLILPDFATGFLDGLNNARSDADRALSVAERLTIVGAFLACGFTWWVINRLRAILLSVNQGDAFERANVKRLQAVGFGLLGIQVTAILLPWSRRSASIRPPPTMTSDWDPGWAFWSSSSWPRCSARARPCATNN